MRTWTSPAGIAFEDVQTGDGRIYVADAFYWDDPGQGWPHRADLEDDGWHAGALLIGAITSMERRSGGVIGAEGWMDDETPHGAAVARMHDQGAPLGVSIDMDDVAVEFIATDIDDDELALMFSAGGLTASAVFTPEGLHSIRIPGLRTVLATAGMTGLLAAAGDGDPEDSVVLWEDSMDSMLMRCTRARIRGLTEVQIPAFATAALLYSAASATVEDTGEDTGDEAPAEEAAALVAAVTGATDLTIADRDTDWDADAARGRMAGAGALADGHFWVDPDGDAESADAYSLPFADVVDDTLTAIPAGIFAAGEAADSGDGIPDDDLDAVRTRISGYYTRMADQFDDDTIVAPWDAAEEPAEEAAAQTAATSSIRVRNRPASASCGCGGTCGGSTCGGHAVAAAAGATPVHPPARFFDALDFSRSDTVTVEDPQTGRTLRGVPMQYEASGEVAGHIGMWGQCHTGSPGGQCVLTPRSPSNYLWFQHGHIELDDGTLIPTGNLTLGGGHADIRLSYRAALNHYDDVSSQAAQVTAGEDEFGVWIHGGLHPQVGDDDLAMRSLRAASPSGDWRWIGGALELIIAHCVNGPGLPVPRAQVAASGTVLSLVGAGARETALLAAAASAPPEPDMATTIEAAVAAGVAAGVAQAQQAAMARAAAPLRRRLQAHRRDSLRDQLTGGRR